MQKYKIRMMDYMVHFEIKEYFWYEFKVYPIQDYWRGESPNIKRFAYIDKESKSYDMLDEFDEEKALKRFEGTYVYNGDWEGRIYFEDDEFWGHELKDMTILYENYIIKWCENHYDENVNIHKGKL